MRAILTSVAAAAIAATIAVPAVAQVGVEVGVPGVGVRVGEPRPHYRDRYYDGDRYEARRGVRVYEHNTGSACRTTTVRRERADGTMVTKRIRTCD